MEQKHVRWQLYNCVGWCLVVTSWVMVEPSYCFLVVFRSGMPGSKRQRWNEQLIPCKSGTKHGQPTHLSGCTCNYSCCLQLSHLHRSTTKSTLILSVVNSYIIFNKLQLHIGVNVMFHSAIVWTLVPFMFKESMEDNLHRNYSTISC